MVGEILCENGDFKAAHHFTLGSDDPTPTLALPLRDCVAIEKIVKNVMLNLFQHLMESISYETLKRVQGDKK